MADHPIETLMSSALENIKGMVDVNTIVGDPVETPNGEVIIPISRVSFGFAAGGSEFILKTNGNSKDSNGKEVKGSPFGGGSGAGVSLNPVAFLVVGKDQVRLLPVSNNAVLERLINIAPEMMQEIKEIMKNVKKEDKSH
ncbi:MAG: GerW family sporulation protein [Halanaerobiales bacterium]|nr:GerW family sporulation protein [Halanaerobiales bacterium]